MQPLSGNQRPDLLTSLMNMSLVLHLIRKMHLCRSSSNVPRLPSCLEVLQNPHVLLTSAKVHIPLRLTKSGPNLVCSVHFDFKMCFAPQQRALFRHLHFQKWSDPGVLCTFWLRNVLRATTACTFSTLQLPKLLRTWCSVHFDFKMCFAPQRRALFRHCNFQKWSERGVFNILTSKMFRATTACNFSSLIWPAGSAPAALASLLFDPPEPQIIGKTQCFATLLPFRAPGSSFFWDFLFFDLLSSSLRFSSLTLTTSAFHLSILSEVWLLNFLRSVQEVIVISKNEC